MRRQEAAAYAAVETERQVLAGEEGPRASQRSAWQAPLPSMGRCGSTALIAFFAWVGLGADGLSSACYRPEEAYLALGRHTHLGLYMAFATAITVFVVAVAYNQVISFPSGSRPPAWPSRSSGFGFGADCRLHADHRDLGRERCLRCSACCRSGHRPISSPSLILVVLLCFLNLRGVQESIRV
jgi:hypothetical protein